MVSVFDDLVGQQSVVKRLKAAAAIDGTARMTHAWLLTGPPGSGRSSAAVAFAAALQCDTGVGCGQCRACTTTMAGNHADVRRIVPEGLSISVAEMRAIVQLASRRPGVGRWQVVIVEDADRLTEGAANALLKVVEEPPERTVFLLCAPSDNPDDIAVTLRSRCRLIALATPSVTAIEHVLINRDGIDPDMAHWAASVCGGHIGRARRLARDGKARDQRSQALGLARAAMRDSTAYAAVEELIKAADAAAREINAERNERETAELRTALGAGGTGKGAAGALRGSAGVLKQLERTQKSRATRMGRDVLDRALIDLAALFRDSLAVSFGSSTQMMQPDAAELSRRIAECSTPAAVLTCIEAVLRCRQAIEDNVKPKFAVDALVAEIGSALGTSR